MKRLLGFLVGILLLLLSCSNTMEKVYAETSVIELTPEERAFISAHPTIHMGVDPAFIPYEFVDKDGSYKGIASEYLDLIGKRTGLKFEIVKDKTWSAAYEMGVQKELDVLPCVSKTKDREKYFLFSEPYYPFKRVIFVNENTKGIERLEDLFDKKVAVQTNSSHHSYLTGYKNIELSLYTTVEEALQAVSVGKEEAFVGNFATSSYLSKTEGITNLRFVPIETGEKQYLYFAVRDDWPVLRDIINKGLASITQEEKINIDNHWIGVTSDYDYTRIIRIAGIFGAVILLVFMVSLYWIVKLRKEIRNRIRVEEELKVAKEEAEFANRVKSTFLARMSHEIRTPLNAITGMAYIIRKTDISTTQRIYLEKITRAARDMLGIINDILDFSKIEAGKIEIERVPFNMDEVVEQLISIVSYRIEENKIDFSMHKDADIPIYFFGDPKRLEQILLNILGNALKFTSDGAVTLSIRLVARVKDTYTLEFGIKDTGIGMSKEQIDRLFVPFEQADASITRRFGGTGLGLPIVKSFVDLMGGNISIFSEPGEGSTFNVQLSFDADRNKDYEERKKHASIYFKNIRVLVLEKNVFYRNLLKDYLDAFNIVAEFAQSENHTIQLIGAGYAANQKPYNLLILDNDTPQLGGVEFFKRLKNEFVAEKVPKTILLIPQSKEELFDKLEENGLDLGITKPIIPSVLYNGIVEIFKIRVLEEHTIATQGKDGKLLKSQNPCNVLIVEDNRTNQFIAKSILEQAGFTVDLADNGQEGYDLFARHKEKYQIILMDLHMPVMNGFESTQRIRIINDRIPIIAMTADAITGVEEQCRQAGISRYISKPFEPEDFLKTILEAVQEQEAKVPPPLGPSETDSVPEVIERIDEGDAVESDLDTTAGIRNVGGNAELYDLVLNEFFSENENVQKNLYEAISLKDYPAATQIVHKIKSSSGSIGAKSVSRAAGELQKALTAVDEERIETLHHVFNKLIGKVLRAIDERLRRSGLR